MENELIEEIYDTVNGGMSPGFEVPGVENAFAEGSLCAALYQQVFDAERRLEERLGVDGEDEDVETIMGAMCDIQRELCFRMYFYGAKFGVPQE